MAFFAAHMKRVQKHTNATAPGLGPDQPFYDVTCPLRSNGKFRVTWPITNNWSMAASLWVSCWGPHSLCPIEQFAQGDFGGFVWVEYQACCCTRDRV